MLAITALYFSACKPKNTGTAVSGDAASKVYVAPGKYDEFYNCLLYTSDAADDLLCVDLGGGRTIKKKRKNTRNEN